MLRTSSIRTQPQLATNVASQSHKSPSRLAGNEMDYTDRQTNNNHVIPRQSRQHESLRNSQSHMSEMASPERANRDSQNQDYVPSFAEYVKNKVIERESKMSGASPPGSNTSRSRVNDAADLPRSTARDASKGSQDPIQKKLSFSDNSAKDTGLNARKSAEATWKEFPQGSSRNVNGGSFGSQGISERRRNNSNEFQRTTRSIYLNGDKEGKGIKNL